MITKLPEIINWYNNLSTSNLELISSFYSKDIYFKDPFHEIVNTEKLKKLYSNMFENLKDPKFLITKILSAENEAVLFWDFTFVMFGKKAIIKGNTLLKFNSSGEIYYHLDYWDSVSELWMKIPFLGFIIKLIYKILF